MVDLDPGGQVHVQRSPRRVTERVLGEELRLDREPVEDARQRAFPGGANRPLGFLQRHQAPAPSGGFPSEVSGSTTAAMLAAAPATAGRRFVGP